MNVKCQARWLCNRSNAVGWTKDNHLETNSKRANFFGGWPSPKIIPNMENISGRDGEVGLVGRAVALLWFRGFADKGEMEMLGEQTSMAEIKATKGEHEQTKTGYCDFGELFELELCEVLVLVDCFQKSTPSNCGRDLVISRDCTAPTLRNMVAQHIVWLETGKPTQNHCKNHCKKCISNFPDKSRSQMPFLNQAKARQGKIPYRHPTGFSI